MHIGTAKIGQGYDRLMSRGGLDKGDYAYGEGIDVNKSTTRRKDIIRNKKV